MTKMFQNVSEKMTEMFQWKKTGSAAPISALQGPCSYFCCEFCIDGELTAAQFDVEHQLELFKDVKSKITLIK